MKRKFSNRQSAWARGREIARIGAPRPLPGKAHPLTIAGYRHEQLEMLRERRLAQYRLPLEDDPGPS